MNSSGPCIVIKIGDHPLLSDLVFDPAPIVAGYNRVRARPEADVLLTVDRYQVHPNTGMWADYGARTVTEGEEVTEFERIDSSPLLIVDDFGAGRAAAFTSDLAPHWAGGLVDWGDERIRVTSEDFEIEVGSEYVEFFGNLLYWVGDGGAAP